LDADHLNQKKARFVFLTFAGCYFLSTLLRAITATLSPTLTQEFELTSSDLGLLAGSYFLGFSLTQLPMGFWLDRYGPKKSRTKIFSAVSHWVLCVFSRPQF